MFQTDVTWHYTDLVLFPLLIISKAGLVGSFVEQVMDNRTKMKFNKMSGSALIYKLLVHMILYAIQKKSHHCLVGSKGKAANQ